MKLHPEGSAEIHHDRWSHGGNAEYYCTCFMSGKLEEKEICAWLWSSGTWFSYCAQSPNPAACYHLDLSCSWALWWAAMPKKTWQAKLGACHPILKSLLPRMGLALLFPSTDCQVITTKNSSHLKYEPWDFIRWSSICQALKQHVCVRCFPFGGKWKFGMVA